MKKRRIVLELLDNLKSGHVGVISTRRTPNPQAIEVHMGCLDSILAWESV